MSLPRFLTRLIWLCMLPMVLLTLYLALTNVQLHQTQRQQEAQSLTRDLASLLDQDLHTAQAPAQASWVNPVTPQQLQTRLDQVSLPAGWSLILLDGKRQTLAQRGPPTQLADTPLEETAQRFMSSTMAAPWRVVLEIPRSLYRAPVLEAAGLMTIALLGAALAGLLGGRLASRQLTAAANAQEAAEIALSDSTLIRTRLQTEIEQHQHTEALLRMAFKGANAGSYEWNSETGMTLWSGELWALLGLAPHAAPASYATWRQAVHPDDLERVELTIGKALLQGVEYETEWRVNLAPGTPPRWLLDRASPMPDANNPVLRYRGMMIDITERKQTALALEQSYRHLEQRVAKRTARLSAAEAEQRRLNRALRLLSDCNVALVHATDERQLLHDLCHLIVSACGYQMGWVGMAVHDAEKSVQPVAHFGHDAGFLKDLQLSWDAQQPTGQGPVGQAMRSGTTQVNPDFASNPAMAPWRTLAGQLGYQSSVTLPLLIEQQVLGVLTLYSSESRSFGPDEVKLLEELASDMAFGLQSLRARSELTRNQLQLEERVTQRTQEIALLNTELVTQVSVADAANHAKSIFLSTMSHELRTPLNAVIGLAGLLVAAPLGRRQRDYADKIQLSAQALRALIDDILDFSKIEAQALTLEQAPISLSVLLRTTAAVMGIGIGSKPIEALISVAPGVPDALVGDPLRLQQILLNLTSNAVKFTQTGEVVLSVRCLSPVAEQVRLQFTVRDTGIGIAQAQLNHIFDGFIQANAATSRLYGGSGLGLTISDRLARLMDGEIRVDSVLEQGSEFRFEVTLALGRPVPVALSPAIPPDLHILIVDDHPLARTLLTQTCAGLGWQATAVDSAAAALQALRHSGAQGRDYDLMLLDWYMPDMDGLEMLHQAHVSGDIGLPLVVLMAPIFELEQAVAASDNLNLDGIVTKPLTPTSLLDAVTRAYTGEALNTPALPARTDLRLAGLRLLVAEDNPLNQEVLETILSNAGAQVVLVDNGLLAVNALRSPRAVFDAVLMDLQMPVMDGFTATRIIREELGRVDLPIIAVTAYAQAADRENSRLAGMVGHIVKPLDIGNLLAILALEPVVDQPMPAAPLTGLDVTAALHQFGGDKKKYQDVLVKFKLRHSADVTAMRRFHQTSNNAGAIRLAHDMGGIAGFLQAPEVARLAAATEAALLADQTDLLPFLFDELQTALLDLALAIDQFTAS